MEENVLDLKEEDIENQENGFSEANFKTELKNTLKNRKTQVKMMNTGRTVSVSNSNQLSSSRACSIQ